MAVVRVNLWSLFQTQTSDLTFLFKWFFFLLKFVILLISAVIRISNETVINWKEVHVFSCLHAVHGAASCWWWGLFSCFTCFSFYVPSSSLMLFRRQHLDLWHVVSFLKCDGGFSQRWSLTIISSQRLKTMASDWTDRISYPSRMIKKPNNADSESLPSNALWDTELGPGETGETSSGQTGADLQSLLVSIVAVTAEDKIQEN